MNSSSNQTSNAENKPLEQTTTPKATTQSSQTVKSKPVSGSFFHNYYDMFFVNRLKVVTDLQVSQQPLAG